MFYILLNVKELNHKNNQYLRDKKAATPALTHESSPSLEGISKNITKLVECPVVERVPLLETTL